MTGIDSGLRQTCKVCGRPDKFNFNISDWMWRDVVPKHLWHKVVCLYCFDDFAHKKGVNYARHLHTLYFAGEAEVFEFRAISDCNYPPSF